MFFTEYIGTCLDTKADSPPPHLRKRTRKVKNVPPSPPQPEVDPIVMEVRNIVYKPNDESEALGQLVAVKHRRMNPLERPFFDKLLADLLFKANSDHLSESSVLWLILLVRFYPLPLASTSPILPPKPFLPNAPYSHLLPFTHPLSRPEKYWCNSTKSAVTSQLALPYRYPCPLRGQDPNPPNFGISPTSSKMMKTFSIFYFRNLLFCRYTFFYCSYYFFDKKCI